MSGEDSIYLKEKDTRQPLRYRIIWLAFVLAIILCVTFFPYLFGGKTFLPSDMVDTMTAPFNAQYGPPQAQNHYPFDALAQTLPYKVQTKEALSNGTLAYWNTHILGGYPQYAASLGNNFDIFNIALFFASPSDTILIETVLELFIAGLGMIFLLRFFGVSPLVNLLFAMAFMLNSLFIASAMHRWMIASFCWVPFVVLMIVRYYYYDQKEELFYASVFLALSFLGGNFQTSFFAAFVVTVVVTFSPRYASHQKFMVRIGVLTFIGITAFALSAVMWLPTLELLFETIFRGGSLNSTSVFDSYTIFQRILSLPLLGYFFLPTLAGSPQIYSIKNIAGADMIDFNGAISFLPALFAFFGCFTLWKRRAIRPFIIIVALGLLLPIATPLFSFLYHRFFIVASFSLCVVGAVTFQSFIDNDSTRKSFFSLFRWIKVIYALLIIALGAVCIYISLNYQSLFSKFTDYLSPKIKDSAFGSGNESWMFGRVEKTLRYYSLSSIPLWLPIIAAGMILLSLAYFHRGKLSKKNMLLIVFLSSAVQLILFSRMWLPSIDTHKFPIYPDNPITSYLQGHSEAGRYYTWHNASKEPPILPANCSDVYKTNDLQGYESCTSRSMSVFYKRHIHPDSLDLRLLGLANVKYIVTGNRNISSSNARKIFTADGLSIYENVLAKPRAYFAYRSNVVESDSTAALNLLLPDFDGSIALFTKHDMPSQDLTGTESKNSIRFVRSDNEELLIQTQTDKRGVFILTDTYYPGWKCYVNNHEKPIYRVNNCMRGVIVDEGISSIHFRFEPGVFSIGASISVVAVLLCVSSIPVLRKKQKRDLIAKERNNI